MLSAVYGVSILLSVGLVGVAGARFWRGRLVSSVQSISFTYVIELQIRTRHRSCIDSLDRSRGGVECTRQSMRWYLINACSFLVSCDWTSVLINTFIRFSRVSVCVYRWREGERIHECSVHLLDYNSKYLIIRSHEQYVTPENCVRFKFHWFPIGFIVWVGVEYHLSHMFLTRLGDAQIRIRVG